MKTTRMGMKCDLCGREALWIVRSEADLDFANRSRAATVKAHADRCEGTIVFVEREEPVS